MASTITRRIDNRKQRLIKLRDDLRQHSRTVCDPFIKYLFTLLDHKTDYQITGVYCSAHQLVPEKTPMSFKTMGSTPGQSFYTCKCKNSTKCYIAAMDACGRLSIPSINPETEQMAKYKALCLTYNIPLNSPQVHLSVRNQSWSENLDIVLKNHYGETLLRRLLESPDSLFHQELTNCGPNFNYSILHNIFFIPFLPVSLLAKVLDCLVTEKVITKKDTHIYVCQQKMYNQTDISHYLTETTLFKKVHDIGSDRRLCTETTGGENGNKRLSAKCPVTLYNNHVLLGWLTQQYDLTKTLDD
jgi:hypothetical protein